jgi:two-component system, NtrC family, sensor kinase
MTPGTKLPSRARPAGARALRLLWAISVLLPLAGLGTMAAQAWQATVEAAEERVSRTAEMLREQALRAFEAQEIAIAAVESRVVGMSWEEIRASRPLHDFLQTLDAVTPSAGGVTLVDPSGRFAASSTTGFPTPPIEVAGRDYVAAHPPGSGMREAPTIGKVVTSRTVGVLIFPMARPRRRDDGLADGGVVVATLWPHYFQAFYRSILEAPGDTVTLFRLDGAVLAAVPAPADPETAALPAEAAPLLRQLRRGPGLLLHGPSPIDGQPRLLALRRIPGHDVGVAYGLSLSALRLDWQRQMLFPVLGALAAMLVLGTATWWAERAARLRAAAEARSRTAERQATMGLLAGGLAHDFGNITQSVMAAAVLLAKYADNPARVRQVAGHLGRHAERATALSRRMLDTTRRNGLGSQAEGPVELASALRELAQLLDSTLGAGIRVRCEVTGPLLAAPSLDRAELETAVINLAANARDAMPRGGTITITAAQFAVPPRPADAPDLPAGVYIRLSLRDEGEGMPPAALARLGEPFFTTKPEGQGTGLGLAMVAAFVRGSGGALAAESVLGRGTIIHLILPAG